jgi:hypothetical protein
MRVKSVVSDAEFVVVRAPAEAVDLRCGGHSVVARDVEAPPQAIVTGFEGDCVMGKRYGTDDGSIEVMVTKPGPGLLSMGNVVLERKDAKPLPSSD